MTANDAVHIAYQEGDVVLFLYSGVIIAGVILLEDIVENSTSIYYRIQVSSATVSIPKLESIMIVEQDRILGVLRKSLTELVRCLICGQS